MFLVAIVGLLLGFAPAPSSCPAVIIDVGGWHQETVVGIFRATAPDAPLTVISVHDGTELLLAIQRTAECHAKVVSLSLYVNCDCDQVRAVVARAVAADVLLVAASGNDGPATPTWFPAGYPGVLAVEATEHPSNPGRIAASTATSWATPRVSATAYRMRELNPALTAISTTFILTSTAKNGVLDPVGALAGAVGGYRLYLPAIKETAQ